MGQRQVDPGSSPQTSQNGKLRVQEKKPSLKAIRQKTVEDTVHTRHTYKEEEEEEEDREFRLTQGLPLTEKISKPNTGVCPGDKYKGRRKKCREENRMA